MSMSKSNSKGKSLGPLFSKKGDGGLKTFEFDIQSGSYFQVNNEHHPTRVGLLEIDKGGWARSSQAVA